MHQNPNTIQLDSAGRQLANKGLASVHPQETWWQHVVVLCFTIMIITVSFLMCQGL